MSLDAALSIATGSLANINRQIALVSQNVANASTPGYAREIAEQQEITADGVGMGVRTGPAQRDVDALLQQSSLSENATVAGLQARQTALQAIDAVQGTPGQGSNIPSLLGSLQDAFSTLGNDPSNQTQQQAVVSAANTLASGINAQSNAIAEQRQAAQDAIVQDVGSLNSTLDTIGALSRQIVSLKAAGQSTADLENQRDDALQTLSQIVDVKVLEQNDGNVMLVTGSGLSLPTDQPDPFSTSAANLGAGAYYPGGGVPAITLGGVDVTEQITGGSLGENITLRDTTLPTMQSELDEFSQNLASRFDAQGLRLFSDPSGNVPSGSGIPVQASYVGFSAAITVNPAVQAGPSLVRDGTQAVAGSPTGASAFTPNPPGGPAGFTALITRVLDYALSSEAQSCVPQPWFNSTGLGPTGTFSAPG
ncbi:MAG: flagellar hook-associated protein FlgK, partial [Acetobacteraceae bacterium]|nr:flagellar hook-associated protein FlgK [Acetobacteraceae bacterium]